MSNPHCSHDWVEGPFYVKVAVSYEEPKYYPPQGLVNVEHCTKCGLLRLPELTRKAKHKHLQARGGEGK